MLQISICTLILNQSADNRHFVIWFTFESAAGLIRVNTFHGFVRLRVLLQNLNMYYQRLKQTGRELCREPVSFVVARLASVFAAQKMGMSVVEIGERLTAPSVDPNPT